jgi:hypothetical protein
VLNGLVQVLVTHKQIIAVVVAAVAIASYMLPINSIMASVSVHQSISQSNSGGGYGNVQINDAHNIADVHISSYGHHYNGGGGKANVDQSISQANSIDASSGTAHDNIQSNTASNIAHVHIHSK